MGGFRQAILAYSKAVSHPGSDMEGGWEEEIVRSLRPLASLLGNQLDVTGKEAGVILSGGNMDISRFFEGLR